MRSARLLILAGDVLVNESPVTTVGSAMSRFDRIEVDGHVLQPGTTRCYLMLHKPVGILSATKDSQHRTVVDLIDTAEADSLHLAGRLDRSSSGLILLTNDGNWSENLTEPERKVAKEYLVDTDREIPPTAVDAFRAGFPFEPEGIITKPAQLELISPRRARVILHEGRYHQIKRMFHRLDGIKLTGLHRVRIGSIKLPEKLGPGEWRSLHPEEIESVHHEKNHLPAPASS